MNTLNGNDSRNVSRFFRCVGCVLVLLLAIPFAQALVNTAPARILWGTDWPHPNVGRYMPNDGDLVDLLPLIAPSEELRERLLVKNPAALYDFGR